MALQTDEYRVHPSPVGVKTSGFSLTASLNALLSWFSGLDSFVVVFGACTLTVSAGFLWMQHSPVKRAASHPSAISFPSTLEEPSAATPVQKSAAKNISSLDFIPHARGPLPIPATDPKPGAVLTPAAEPAPPAIPMPTPQAPNFTVPAAPDAALAQLKSPNAGNNSVAQGAAVGVSAKGADQEEAVGSLGAQPAPDLSMPAGASSPQDVSRVVRELAPLIKHVHRGTVFQKYTTMPRHRNYAVEEIGKKILEKNLTISPSAIVTPKDAQAVVSGLGIHIPKTANR